MRAQHYSTAVHDGGYQGDASLLIYDEPALNGTMLSEDVRDLFDSCPSISRIYVLAPFQAKDELFACLSESGVQARIRRYFDDLGGRIYLLWLRLTDEVVDVVATPFFVKEGKLEAQPEEVLPNHVRNGFLFDLFHAHAGRIDAPIGVHFSKASGKHARKFLRTSDVVLSSESAAALAFFSLAGARMGTPARIFVDTAPLMSVALAMQRVGIVNGLWEAHAPVRSFSSYGGIERLPVAAASDIVLISASTSGGLFNRLVQCGFRQANIRTMFFLGSQIDARQAGVLVCDLTFVPGQTFGYEPIENFPANDCKLCREGYFLAELEGDQFLLQKRDIKFLHATTSSQLKEARTQFDRLSKRQLFGAHLFSGQTHRVDVGVQSGDALLAEPSIRDATLRLLKRYTPTPLHYVVLQGLSETAFHDLAEEAGMTSIVAAATLLTPQTLATADAVPRGSALVLFGQLDDYGLARDINALLRTVVPQGCVAYVAGLVVAETAKQLSALRTFLTYGEFGKDTFTFAPAATLMLPMAQRTRTPWDLELELLQRLRDDAEHEPFDATLQARLEVLESAAFRYDGLFLDGVRGALHINHDFVYLKVDGDAAGISQGDIFAVVSNLLACVRVGNKGLTPPTVQEPVHFQRSIYGLVLLDPVNFENYNDAILRAALLRGARDTELHYVGDEHASARMSSVIRASIVGWPRGEGDALPEFLLAMATRRLRLSMVHAEKIRRLVVDADLPDYLKLIAQSICVD